MYAYIRNVENIKIVWDDDNPKIFKFEHDDDLTDIFTDTHIVKIRIEEYNEKNTRRLSFQEYFVKPITLWAIQYPNTPLVVWYDGLMLKYNTIALDNTIRECQQSIEQYGINTNILQFRDVRKIPFVKENPDLFVESRNIEQRYDYLRLIAGYHVINNETDRDKPTIFTYTDFSIIPESPEILLNENTLSVLKDFGNIVLYNGNTIYNFENGFYMLSNQNKDTLQLWEKIYITETADKLKSNSEKNVSFDLKNKFMEQALIQYYNTKYGNTFNVHDGEKALSIAFSYMRVKKKHFKNMIHIKKMMCSWRKSHTPSSSYCIKPMPDLPPISKT